MAVLAPSDWQYLPRDKHTMDFPSNNSRQQRSSPANDSISPSQTTAPLGNHTQFQQMNHQQSQQPPQQSYPYPVQQQPQGSWTPSISAQPFYPSFYQNHQQSPQGYPQLPQQAPYFDPANAQLAQWAYQQMMFNAQQGYIPPQQTRSSSGRSGSGPSPDYFAQNQMNPMFNPFPSGTPPPPHPSRSASVDQQQQQQQNGQYPGFHPYRRPVRQGTSSSQTHPHSADGDWRPANVPTPPYARPDASGSSSSVNSTNSQRQRTNSNQSGNSGQNTPPGGSIRSRNGSPAVANNQQPASTSAIPARSSPSGSFSSTNSSNLSTQKIPHNRNLSSSSVGSSTTSNRPSGLAPSITSPTMSTTSSTPPSSASSSTNLRPARPSPLSQGTFTASEKRMSRDDSDLAAMLESTPSAAMIRSGGLKGRLRRALNFNAQQQALREEEDDDDVSIKASALGSSSANLKSKSTHSINTAVGKSNPGGGVPSPDIDDAESTATVQTKKKSRAASLFNSRLNASTDNISLSSTVSSASVMIRKLGSMGKLARRNSLAGITSLFKDKDKKNKEKEKEEGETTDKKSKKKKSAKAEASEASVSHVTAELDRSAGDWGGPEMNGLSPAAKLARQHTLKSNAEAAARAKAQQDAAAVVVAAAATSTQLNGNGPGAGVPAWEKNTHTRQGSASPVKGSAGFRINEDGTRVLVEDDEEDRSDDGHYGVPAPSAGDYTPEGWDDDEDWDGEEDEDVTIRLGIERVNMDDEYEEPDPWATDVRRSVERTRVPAKGILKHAATYDQKSYLTENVTVNRVRSNSYNSHTNQTELGPLARIPSPDPDHIDGLHRHGSHSGGHGSNSTVTAAPTIPPLSFEPSAPSPIRATGIDSPRDSIDSTSTVSHAPHAPEKSSLLFSHSNSSAPALSTMSSKAPTLTHRSATTPSKRLAFANNLSVYDTFPPSVYDRRSEPATWSRLTPALAQRIKEELNSYKMEEMEVHAASRIHTQFFV
ncbi:hypothetical protein J3R30DRAFT_3696684 [Lentinula aciculospora]|uniref:Protein BNI4 n=1 Tax=Lentinula aciculospora TaxID=153920 RepID=A0A9W9DUZ3_9AGAR|nr:hypothetical protein J3R30DRAFT_3696684 [Lentinula aciculospora]